MATPYAVPVVAREPPSLWVLRTIALAGLVTGACSLALALTNDGVSGVQVALLEWISIPYIVAGLIAWWRRPDSRLGVLMIAGGFATALSALAFARFAFPHTIGVIFDVLPAVIFLHVYLAFPSGRLRSPFERGLVATGYVAAVGLQLVKMSLGGVGPQNLLELSTRTAAAASVEQVQLLSISAICLAGIGVLAARRRDAGRPRRRPVALLIDSFALGLVMIAVLFVSGAFQGPAFLTIQRATLLVIGISPIAFLIGLLDARLARSAVGDLFVELRADPSPAGLREALARALRDPSLTLAYWLPEFETWADLDGRPVELPEPAGWQGDDADRPGRRAHGRAPARPRVGGRARVARGGRRGGRDRTRERTSAGGAEGAPGGAEGLARAGDRGGPEGAAAAGAQPPRRRPAAAGRPLARVEPAREAAGGRPSGGESTRSGAATRSRSRSTSCARWRAVSIRRCSAGTGSRWRSSRSLRHSPTPGRLDGDA